MSELDAIMTFENLYKAHRVARLGKRHKKEVVEFELNLSQNLWDLYYDLKYKKYKIGGYHTFTIYDPKQREIQAITYRDRIVQHALCDNYLTPLLERYYIYDNCACRKGKGTHFAIKRLRKFMCGHCKRYGINGYFVKIDVSKFFHNIDHNMLKQKLVRIIKDNDVRDLLNTIINSYHHTLGKGLPMGNQTSQNFALLYLNDLDHFIKERLKVKYYVRYMDDLIMIVKTKSQAKYVYNACKNGVQNLAMVINPKSCITKYKNGITFLGWHFKHSSTKKIVQKVKRQLKYRILHKLFLVKSNKLKSTLASYKEFLFFGNGCQFFKKLLCCKNLEFM